MGLDPDIQPTPAVALGAYDMTPLEVAAGYTVFANGGVRAEPMFIDRVVDSQGAAIERGAVRTRAALDPRVAYQVTNILEDVINHGTGATVRARGFHGPAAGKTGTSRDGWFAGYTSNLLCIVWVGFDDNRDLGLSGAASAAPIWAEFMKRATALPAYHDLQRFRAARGRDHGGYRSHDHAIGHACLPGHAQGSLHHRYRAYGVLRIARRTHDDPDASAVLALAICSVQAPKPEDAGAAADASTGAKPAGSAPAANAAPPSPPTASSETDNKKPGVIGRFFGIFGGKKTDQNSPNNDSSNQGNPGNQSNPGNPGH